MNQTRPRTVAVSGGFDPLHVGHLRMFRDARSLGDRLVVILNNDNWLKDKKGYAFMPEDERKEIIGSLPFVDDVVITSHTPDCVDRSVCEELRAIKPQVFANGGDRRGIDDIPEAAVCEELGIEMSFGIGGGKVQSSSWLTSKLRKHENRPWGDMDTYQQEKHWWVKRLTVRAGESLSLQKHSRRGETWVCVDGQGIAEIGGTQHNLARGTVVWFGPGTIHQLMGIKDCTIIEVAHGEEMSEDDIKRYEDKYGRA